MAFQKGLVILLACLHAAVVASVGGGFELPFRAAVPCIGCVAPDVALGSLGNASVELLGAMPAFSDSVGEEHMLFEAFPTVPPLAAHPRALPESLLQRVTNPVSTEAAVAELTEGAGFVVLTDVVPEAVLTAAQKRLDEFLGASSTVYDAAEVNEETGHDRIYADSKDPNATRTQGHRVWNLVNKGLAFETLVQMPEVMSIVESVVGSDCILGSFAANALPPHAGHQNPHLDYPYWDYDDSKAWPAVPKGGPGHGYFMNMQMLIMMHDFTYENGATAVLPYSQLEARWPDAEEFERDFKQVTGKAGTVFLFTGLLHHASMTNESPTGAYRTSLLGQYLPKFVRPMEDPAAVGPEVRARATPKMRQLLGYHQPYPKRFDHDE